MFDLPLYIALPWKETVQHDELLEIVVRKLDAAKDSKELCRQHYRLGYITEKQDKDQKALKNYQKAFDIDPTYLPALEGLGGALVKTEKWDEAQKIYQTILIHHRESLTEAEIVAACNALTAVSTPLNPLAEVTRNDFRSVNGAKGKLLSP